MFSTAIAVIFHSYFSASVTSLKCARAQSMSSMSSCLFVTWAHVRPRGRVVSWFVCLCVHIFFACSVFSGPLKLTFSSGKVAFANIPTFLRSAYRSEHSKAQKKLFFLTFRLCLNQAFFFDNRVINASLVFLYDD